nr:MAG TPA: hypothetical protein [Caudoviricetes sp.]
MRCCHSFSCIDIAAKNHLACIADRIFQFRHFLTFLPPSILPQKGATHKEVHIHYERLDHIH